MSYFVINPFTAVDVQGTALSITSQATGTFAGAGVYGNAVTSAGTGLGRFVGAGVSEGRFSSDGASALNWYGVNAIVGAGDLSSDGTGAMTFEGTWTNVQEATISSDGVGAATIVPASTAAAAYDIDSAGSGTFITLITLLLAHFNGTDGATTFTDEVGGVTWTTTGGAPSIDTAQSVFGGSSLLFTYTIGTEQVKATGIGSPHAGSWTIERFVRHGGESSWSEVSVVTATAVLLYVGSSPDSVSLLVYKDGGANIVNHQLVPTVATNTWYHVAAVRDVDAGTYALYFDGNRLGVTSTAENSKDWGDGIVITQNSALNDEWNEEVRVSKIARYSGTTYTVPTSPFTVD